MSEKAMKMIYDWEAHSNGWQMVSGDNAREHWAVKARRAKLQREGAHLRTLAVWTGPRAVSDRVRLRVTIERIGKRRMDDDNLAGSAKHVRDGIAAAVGIDDGDLRYTWTYKQSIGLRYGVRVQIEVVA